jgi:VWFA-related protein
MLLAAAPLGAYVVQEPFKIVDNVDLVLLDVSVRDSRGGYVTDVPESAFRVAVDGKPQKLSTFAKADAPVTIGLILDNSGSMRYKRNEVVLSGLAFAKESNPQDEFFVVNFNNTVAPGLPAKVPFTDDIQLLHSALNWGASVGQTALYDAIAYGLKHLEQGHREKRTLIVVSDGGDNVSELKQRDILNLIQQSRATIYTIGLLDPDDRDLQPAILKRFARISGGEYFEPEKLDDVPKVLNKISQDIRTRYTLGFTPVAGTDNQMHQIKVSASMDGRHLSVRTRTAYTTSTYTIQETSLRDWR